MGTGWPNLLVVVIILACITVTVGVITGAQHRWALIWTFTILEALILVLNLPKLVVRIQRWPWFSMCFLSQTRLSRKGYLLDRGLVEVEHRWELVFPHRREVCETGVVLSCFFSRSVRDSETAYRLLITIHLRLAWMLDDLDHSILLVGVIAKKLKVARGVLGVLQWLCDSLEEGIVIRACWIVVKGECSLLFKTT